MGLPDLSLPTKRIELHGGRSIEVRALSHGEALEIGELTGDGDYEAMAPAEQRRFHVMVLKAAFEEPDDEAIEAFMRGSITTADVQAIVQGVLDASGLGQGEDGRPTETPSPDG